MELDIGLLVLRLLFGVLLIGHGTQKLFGWFGGHGIEGTGGMFGSLGYPAPRQMAILTGIVEAGSGVLLVLGIGLPLAAAGLIGVMLNAAVSVHAPNGLWVQNSGYEYPLVVAVTATVVALTGPGLYSLGAAVGDISGPAWTLAAIVVGIAAATAGLSLRRTEVAAESAS